MGWISFGLKTNGCLDQEMSPPRAFIHKVVRNEWVKYNFCLNYSFMALNLAEIMDRLAAALDCRGGPFGTVCPPRSARPSHGRMAA